MQTDLISFSLQHIVTQDGWIHHIQLPSLSLTHSHRGAQQAEADERKMAVTLRRYVMHLPEMFWD